MSFLGRQDDGHRLKRNATSTDGGDKQPDDITTMMVGTTVRQQVMRVNDLSPPLSEVVSARTTTLCFLLTFLVSSLPVILFVSLYSSYVMTLTSEGLELVDCYTNILVPLIGLGLAALIPITMQLFGVARLHYRRSLFGVLYSVALVS